MLFIYGKYSYYQCCNIAEVFADKYRSTTKKNMQEYESLLNFARSNAYKKVLTEVI